jgi:SpoVK/Ycf46/Vps4 family AAA+-type ATPase
VGNAEMTIRDTFERARGVAPCIVFIDELDALVANRDNSNSNSVNFLLFSI